jgi:sodium transport system permease protein
MSAPVARWELLLGKSLAGLLFTCAIVALNLLAFRHALLKAVEGVSGMAPPPGNEVYLALFLLCIPMAALAVGVQVTIAAITRSAKEAQIYLGLLPTLPLIPGLMLVFNPVPPGMGMAAVPVFGQLALFLELTNGRSLAPELVIISVISTMIAAGLVFWLASRMFQRERMIFGA